MSRLVRGRGSAGIPTVRMSVTIEQAHAEAISKLAREHKVSDAWIIREAVERYLIARNAIPPE